jgi:hypothetical protein
MTVGVDTGEREREHGRERDVFLYLKSCRFRSLMGHDGIFEDARFDLLTASLNKPHIY